MAETPKITLRVPDEAIAGASRSVREAMLWGPRARPEVPRLLRAGLYALTMLGPADVETAWALAELRRGWPPRRRSEAS